MTQNTRIVYFALDESNSTLKKLKLVERIKFYEKKSYVPAGTNNFNRLN